MATSRQSAATSTAQSTFLWAEPPASPTRSQDFEAAWLTLVATSCLSSAHLLNASAPAGWYGRTSPASCHLAADGILVPSSRCWQNSGMGSPTAFLTLSTLEFHSAAVASSLSDILEIGAVPPQYYLSATACRGILRRAEKRGKTLPGQLLRALVAVADSRTAEARLDTSNQ
jgi:hypothetical protein